MENKNITQLISVSDNEINRGHIYWAAIQFTEERPLGIFKSTYGDDGIKITEDANTFKGRFNSITNRKESEIVDVIIRHKRRMVTVIQSEDSIASFIYVLPITTYSGNNKKIEIIKNNLNNPQFQYIGSLTGKEAVVNISDMKRIHKFLLMEKVGQTQISEENLEIIGKKLATLIDIEKIEKCDECIHNYENYIKNKELEEFNKVANE
ncbi:hypothetical protein [Clostridium tarantellae]|uniref:Uncharacterized protein n=1 Tax=Clostridium tarantellae TaxID=39493 RepID=A0A6I1MI92_9CLOT|nr:hypothetical protein [Clostridium tarantellae]MPQ42624.1 hypothetical protein [Clostridium tarantellae]